ncbi:MAG: type II toxin-antitoxin system RelE/ParE family toxin [Verrucomicrobia bacterium]|nr:type II toxin-antitoxin system RelE/ParE family toxin [Verrucomicrobiota bacterium]
MINSFADAMTEEIFEGIYTHAIRKKFSSSIVKMAERKLDLLNSVETFETLEAIPSHRGGGLKRDVQDFYSIPLTGNFRLCFRWNGNNAEDVAIR